MDCAWWNPICTARQAAQNRSDAERIAASEAALQERRRAEGWANDNPWANDPHWRAQHDANLASEAAGVAENSDILAEFTPGALVDNLADSAATAADRIQGGINRTVPGWLIVVIVLALVAYLVGPGTVGRLIPGGGK